MECPTATPARLLFPVLTLAGALACGGGDAGETPVATVRHFLQAMDRSAADSGGLLDAYELLDEGARTALADRARRTSALTGLDTEPWRMLAQGRFRLRFAPASPGGLKERIEGDTALVFVSGGRAEQRAEIPLVREKGKWRIRLEIPPMHRSSP